MLEPYYKRKGWSKKNKGFGNNHYNFHFEWVWVFWCTLCDQDSTYKILPWFWGVYGESHVNKKCELEKNCLHRIFSTPSHSFLLIILFLVKLFVGSWKFFPSGAMGVKFTSSVTHNSGFWTNFQWILSIFLNRVFKRWNHVCWRRLTRKNEKHCCVGCNCDLCNLWTC